MPILTQPYEAYEKPGIVVNYKVANTKIYKGALVGVNGAGYAVPIAHGTAGLKFVGIANETVDNSTGASGDKSLNVTKTGTFIMKAASGFTPGLANLGSEVYANSDWEVQVVVTGLTNLYKVGTITGLENTSSGSTGVRVRIANYTV